MQGRGTGEAIHSSIQQASASGADYGSLMAWRMVTATCGGVVLLVIAAVKRVSTCVPLLCRLHSDAGGGDWPRRILWAAHMTVRAWLVAS